MMSKIFFDTNIILDLLLRRKSVHSNNYQNVLNIIHFCIVSNIPIYFSILGLKNVSYILSKLSKEQTGKNKQLQIKQKINDLLKIGDAIPTSVSAFENAMNSRFPDFEDALQYFTAKEHGVNIIVTRNKKDFIKSDIRIYSPDEFLSLPIK